MLKTFFRAFPPLHCIIGFGVFAKKEFQKYSRLLEYKGDLLEDKDGLERESQYGQENEGCFLYMLRHSGKNMW